jgi:LacI family transcriptional regulator
MGKLADRTVLKLTRGEELDSPRVELATELVVRSSTATMSARGSGGV